MKKKDSSVVFRKCAPDDTAFFAYDLKKKKWKKKWDNDPDRYIGYTTDAKIDYYELSYLFYSLEMNKLPPENEIIYQLPVG